jgi:hypothetical protein
MSELTTSIGLPTAKFDSHPGLIRIDQNVKTRQNRIHSSSLVRQSVLHTPNN